MSPAFSFPVPSDTLLSVPVFPPSATIVSSFGSSFAATSAFVASVLSVASSIFVPSDTFTSVPSVFTNVPPSDTLISLTDNFPLSVSAFPVKTVLLPLLSTTSIVASPLSLTVALPSNFDVFPSASV